MELKVWVEGIQRIVCGVTEATTCQEVVFALAHATGKSGRFTLIERWRNNERQLSPTENPVKIIMKWGEYSNDVQFILQRSDSYKTEQSLNPVKPKSSNNINKLYNTSGPESSPKQKDSIKPLTFSNNHLSGSENIGIVKGVPQMKPTSLEVNESLLNSPHNSPKKSSYSGSEKSESPSQRVAPPYKDPPAPPPYRDPPPPNCSIYQDKYKKNSIQENLKNQSEKDENRNNFQDNVLYNNQYRELIALVNYQREKISSQQADLTKYDAEIVFLEGKEKEKQRQLDHLSREIIAFTNLSKSNQEQIQALSHVAGESEIIKHQERSLQSEIALIKSKLAKCETDLLQCKNKIRLLMDEVHLEQRVENRRSESRKQLDQNLLLEVERLQKDIELAKQSTDLQHLTADTLKREVASLECAINEKKKQVEHLVAEMKEANLQSLSISPPEDIRHIVEGPVKSGSMRKMIGSPRQLENAVPTNKNPHGVWV